MPCVSRTPPSPLLCAAFMSVCDTVGQWVRTLTDTKHKPFFVSAKNVFVALSIKNNQYQKVVDAS